MPSLLRMHFLVLILIWLVITAGGNVFKEYDIEMKNAMVRIELLIDCA